MQQYSFKSYIGMLTLSEDKGLLSSITFADEGGHTATALMQEAEVQLHAYFAGELQRFTLPLGAAGTPFQRSVWEALLAIPYGETCSYGALAAAIGNPGAVRAVGTACGKNPLPIVVPCHRIIRGDGSVGNYAGGVAVKRALLAVEGVGGEGKG